jgi:hypothetical protein
MIRKKSAYKNQVNLFLGPHSQPFWRGGRGGGPSGGGGMGGGLSV